MNVTEKLSLIRCKTLWEKEKMLVTSIFSLSYNIFKRFLFQDFQKPALCGKGLNCVHSVVKWGLHLYPFPKQALVFMCLQYKSFENTVGKGEIARNEQFLLFPQFFPPFWNTFCQFHQI